MNGRQLIRKTRVFNHCAGTAGVVVTSLIAFCAWLCVIKPIDAAIEWDRTRQMGAHKCLDNRDDIAGEAARLRIERSGFESRLKELLDGIPESVQDSQFLGQVATLARDSELLLEQFRPGTIEKSGDYQQLEIELTASGTHASICRFLDGLQNLPRLCRVPELDIEASGEEQVFPVRLKVLVFFAPDESESNEKQEAVDGLR